MPASCLPPWASQVALVVKNPPANTGDEMWEMQFQFLGREDLLEGGMATHSGILAWRVPRTEEPGGLQPIGSQKVRHTWSDLARMNICFLSEFPDKPSWCNWARHLVATVFFRRNWKEKINFFTQFFKNCQCIIDQTSTNTSHVTADTVGPGKGIVNSRTLPHLNPSDLEA